MSSQSGTGPRGALPRPHFEAGRYLAASDLLTEQRYRLHRDRRHNRFLHGWGVVCGLLVVPARDPAHPWAVSICPGFAIGPYGDDIEVGVPVRVDLRDYLWYMPVPAATMGIIRIFWVGIRHEDIPRRPAPETPPGCGCPDPRYGPTRSADGYRAEARWAVPEPSVDSADLCEPAVRPCAACPDSPWVWLARVALPASESMPLTPLHIHNESRRLLLSTTPIRAQLTDCCCVNVVSPSG
jgi:hypothetical protein